MCENEIEMQKHEEHNAKLSGQLRIFGFSVFYGVIVIEITYTNVNKH